MGYEQRTMKIAAYVSRHNSEQDEKDDALWMDFWERVFQISREEKYQQIRMMVD